MSEKNLSTEELANLDKLPDWCFGRNPSTDTIIRIDKGEMGYSPVANQDWPKGMAKEQGISLDAFIDKINHNIGVTPAQRQAMQFGSMWGWHIRLADPDMYDEKGNIIHEKLNTKY